MGDSSISKAIPYTIFFIAVNSIGGHTSLPIGNTMIWWLIQALILIAYLWEIRFSNINPTDKRHIRIVTWLLLYNIFSLIRGVFIVENYWDVKNLVGNIFVLLLPIIAYLTTDHFKVQTILSVFIKFVLPMFVFFIPFLDIGAWSLYLFPISFLILFFPVLTKRWKIFLLVTTPILMLSDLGSRSMVIKFGIPALLLIFYYFRYFIGLTRIMELGRKALFIAPFLFFFLAVSGTFNIFNIQSYIKGEYTDTNVNSEGETTVENLKADTRTGLYKEVLHSAEKNNYWWIGRSPARGNDSKIFANISKTTGRKERNSNEVAILNIFTWTGIIGVLIYCFVFFRASQLAINRSNNIFSKLIGLLIAFHWLYSWIEDKNSFDLSNFVIWMMIGLSFSISFRQMNNTEVKLWVRGVFEKKYYVAYRKYMLGK